MLSLKEQIGSVFKVGTSTQNTLMDRIAPPRPHVSLDCTFRATAAEIGVWVRISIRKQCEPPRRGERLLRGLIGSRLHVAIDGLAALSATSGRSNGKLVPIRLVCSVKQGQPDSCQPLVDRRRKRETILTSSRIPLGRRTRTPANTAPMMTICSAATRA
jgi:hypothetical protein